MDKYRRVEKSKTADAEAQPVAANEIRITQTGKVRSYISYANGLFADKQEQSVVLKAMGNAISKAVTVAEILKHRVAHLHQITQISSIETVDVYEPLEEGLDRIETKRHIPSISITLSLKQLNTSDPGYQSPIPVEMVSTTPFDEQEHKKTRKVRNKRPTKPASPASDSPAPEEDSVTTKSEKPSTAAASAAVEQEESSSSAVTRDSNSSKRGRGGRGGRGSTRGGRKPGAGRGESNKSGTNSDAKVAASEPAKEQTTDAHAAPAAPARKNKPRKQRPAAAADSSDANGESSEKENKSSSNQSADPTEHTPTKSHTSTRGGRGGRGYTRGRGRGRGRGSAGRGNNAATEPSAAAASADN